MTLLKVASLLYQQAAHQNQTADTFPTFYEPLYERCRAPCYANIDQAAKTGRGMMFQIMLSVHMGT